MRLLIINHEYPPLGGGAASAASFIAKNLSGPQKKIDVLTSSFKNLPHEEKFDNYAVKRIAGFRKNIHTGALLGYIFFVINGTIFCLTKLRKEKYDRVYAFFTLPGGLIAFFIKKFLKVPYFVFLRGIDVPGFYGGKYSFLNKLLRPLIKHIWINSDAVIANSESLKKLAEKTLDKKPIYVVPNGIDAEKFFPKVDKIARRDLKIIYVGRLNKQKGLEYLIEALSLLNGVSFIAEIIGDGPEKNSLDAKIKQLGLRKKVFLAGWKDRDNLVNIYQAADIFISPSLDEGMPNTVLEALGCGLPIVASDIPPHRELIEEGINGFLIPFKDPKFFSDKIKILIQDEALRLRMRNENLIKAKNYSWHNIARMIENIEGRIK